MQTTTTTATQATSIAKTAIFHIATGFVVAVVVLTEVTIPANSSLLLRIALVVAGLAFLVAGATVYLYSELHESIGCLVLNIAAFALIFSTLQTEISGDPRLIFATRLLASVIPALLVRAFYDVAPIERGRRLVVTAFDSVAVLTVAFLIVATVLQISTALQIDDDLIRTACYASFTVSLIGAMGVAISLMVRTRDSSIRTGLLLILIAAAIQSVLMLGWGSLDPASPLTGLWVLSSILLPLAVVAPTFRNRLADMRLQRDLVYALLTAIVSGAYASALVALSLTMRLSGLAAAVSIGAISIAFVPIVRAVHRAVDRWFYQDAYDYRAVLTKFSSATPEFRNADDLAQRLCTEVMSALNPRWCAVYAGSGSGRILLHATDPVAAELASRDVEHESIATRRFTLGEPGHDVGQLVIGLPSRRARLRLVDSDLLRTIAYQAGIVLENSQLIASLDERIRHLEDVQHATRVLHRRLSESEERTRAELSRDLHDSALQSLFHLIRMAEDLSADTESPPIPSSEASDRVARLADLGRDIAFELRQVCEDLRPPMLDQLSLPLALEALANRYRTLFGLDVSLRVTGVTGVTGDADAPDTHQATVLYRATGEALANAQRHARATRIALELDVTSESIRLKIHDNGLGFSIQPADLLNLTEAGHLGLAGMFERVDGLHGRIDIGTNDDGGTTVDITLPTTPLVPADSREAAPDARVLSGAASLLPIDK